MTQTKKTTTTTRKERSLIRSLEMVNFNENPIFTGVYVETKTIEPDDKNKEPFQQHVFIDTNSGELVYVPDNYSITKAIKMATGLGVDWEKEAMEIIFKGKSEVGGKPFSRFDISLIEI